MASPGYAAGEALPALTDILNGLPPANTPAVEVIAQPGSTWIYSGGGYTVAQLLVEEAAGLPFPEAAQELALKPMGMSHSGYFQPLPDILCDQAAVGPQRRRAALARFVAHSPRAGSGGFVDEPNRISSISLCGDDRFGG